MKEWYVEDPIEPDLSFEEVLQQIELSQKQFQQTDWAILSRWLVKRSSSGPKVLESGGREASDHDGDSVD